MSAYEDTILFVRGRILAILDQLPWRSARYVNMSDEPQSIEVERRAYKAGYTEALALLKRALLEENYHD